jgi:tripartite-type tricarboxylate transporter receptor subunit TctC
MKGSGGKLNRFIRKGGFEMLRKRRTTGVTVAVFSALLLTFSAAIAQEYPTRPITLIVQFSAGTTTDIIGRRLAEEASKILGQPIVTINKAGGGGSVGVAEVVRSKPDGYTIGCMNMPALAIIPHMQNLPYDPLKDIAHICVVQPYEYGLYVKGDAPWKSLKDLVEYARENPGKVIYGSPGAGTTNHLIMVRIGQRDHLNWKHVPYRGDAEIIPAMLGGHVHAAVGSPAAVMPHVRAGKLKVLVVTNKDRWSYLPGVPTILESGYDFYQASYFSLGARAGIPEAVRGKLEDTFRRIIQNPAIDEEFQKKLYAKLSYMSGAEYAKYIQEQFRFYKEFLKKLGLTPS